jgi:hypothetical protein
MRVRIGVSLGGAGAPGEFEASVGLLETARIDSLWLPETVYGPEVDPVAGMAFALEKTAPTQPLEDFLAGFTGHLMPLQT